MIPVSQIPNQNTPDSPADHHLAFEFPADPSYLSLVRQIVGDIAARHGFSPEAVHEIQIATDEACANAMQHGCSAGKDDVRVCIVCRPHEIDVSVIDRGAGFAFNEQACRPLRDVLQTMPNRGMGLPIIRTLMDEVAYEAGTPHGNVLRMRKSRSACPLS